MFDEDALDEMRYRARSAWVKAKDLLGLPRRGDRTFYVDQFARECSAGRIGPDIVVTTAGRTDGAGSQAQAVMSGLCFATAMGLAYRHTPLTSIEHAERPMQDWVSAWEDTLNFRALGEPDQALPVFPLGDFLKRQSEWKTACVVALPHYLHWSNRHPERYADVQPILRKNFRARNPASSSGAIVVAAHVRRGDISSSNAGSYTPNSEVVALLRNLIRVLSEESAPFEIEVFSQGKREDFADIEALGCTLRIEDSALTSFRELAQADVLVMAKSSFSYSAALLNEGVVLYEPYRQTRPLPDWLVRRPGGGFDEAEFHRGLATLRARHDRRAAAAEILKHREAE